MHLPTVEQAQVFLDKCRGCVYWGSLLASYCRNNPNRQALDTPASSHQVAKAMLLYGSEFVVRLVELDQIALARVSRGECEDFQAREE